MNLRYAVLAIAGVGLAVAGGLMAACGSDDNGSNTPTKAAAASTPASSATQPSGGGGNVLTMAVTAKDFEFTPDTLDATPGETIEVNFTNSGSATHTFTVYSDDAYTQPVANGDSGRVAGGGSMTVRFAAGDGDLYFRCEIHPTQMKGEIAID
jgi:plastocyanin